PDYYLGHSIGELTAAHLAGLWTLTDTAHLITTRATLMHHLPPGGTMLAINTHPHNLTDTLTHHPTATIAAHNSPTNTVIAGPTQTLKTLAAHWRGQGRKVTELNVSHAFHSPLMHDAAQQFAEVAASVTYHPTTTPIISNLTGEPATTEQLTDPHYWASLIEQPVQFSAGLQTLHKHGVTTYLELGPDAILSGLARETLRDPTTAELLPLIRRDRPEATTVLGAAAAAWVSGRDVDWTEVVGTPAPGPAFPLPRYPFQRQTYWLESGTANGSDDENEGEFWDAVTNQDAEALAGLLGDSDTTGALRSLLPALGDWRRQGNWWHRIGWRPDTHVATTATTGRWIVAVAEDGEAEEVVACLAEHGVQVTTLAAGAGLPQSRLAEAIGDGDVTGVLSMLGMRPTLELLDALRTLERTDDVWLLTRGAAAVTAADDPPSLDQAQLAAFGRATVTAYSHQPIALVDVDPGLAAMAQLPGLLAERAEGQEVALRTTGRFVRRLERTRVAPAHDPSAWSPAGRIVLVGEGALASATESWLRTTGAEVVREQRDTVADVLGQPAATQPTAVVLVADGQGKSHGEPLSVADVEREVDALVPVATEIDRLTRDADGPTMVVLGSLAGQLGVPEMVNAAPALAALDALIRRRRAAGCPAVAVAWGSVRGQAAQPAPSGMRPVAVGLALSALDRAGLLGERGDGLVVVDADWATMAQALPAPLLSGLVGTEPVSTAETAGDTGGQWRGAYAAARDDDDRVALLLSLIRGHAAAVLGQPDADAVPVDQEFLELGFTSFTALELYNKLVEVVGVELSPLAIYDHATPAALARHVRDELAHVAGELAPADGES
ncbi:acyltransferase domain-containing protein, partial [Micromonospora lupini]|uniref:acyltransferase domain-containing protein n=1 Tax=Micromonospora lupini TaxID=285679 RepID=UPI00340DB59E